MNHKHKHRSYQQAAAFNVNLMARRSNELFMYTIYLNPSEFPGDYVVKKWEIGPNEMNQDLNFLKITKTLEDARSYLPNGLVNLGRETEDDPVIVESWL